MTILATDWIGAARLASSERELLRVANAFVGTWSRDQLAALPADCQVREVDSLDAISSAAFSLVRHECSLEPVDHPAILQAMAQFFAAAATRGAELRARARGFRPLGIPTIATSPRG